MKLKELIEQPEQLDEINLKQAIAAGLIGTTALAPHAQAQQVDMEWSNPQGRPGVHQTVNVPVVQPQRDKLALAIASRYKVNYNFARNVVDLAYKHQKPTFPRAKDIIAVIGVESSFNPWAVSTLKKDPAQGLMQVRPGKWKVEPGQLTDIGKQIELGSTILHKYYRVLKDKHAAVGAYNVGLASYQKGDYNPRYVDKYVQELQYYEHL